MNSIDNTFFPLVKSDAIFSDDRIHRYTLWRIWNKELPKVLFIGLNPSTATETKNDPTIRRCMGYAKYWGYGGYIMGNIFAFRSTNPAKLRNTSDPIGPKNDYWLKRLYEEADLTIAAWGTNGKYMNRGNQVLELFSNLKCLRITKNGYPSHPLYLPKNLKPIHYK
ncbi:MAG: hypothetical protein CMF96_00515 [Candidatus Marinimicrobia bacterium]|nr:hypothetical protein [Candidatus Neomarinimicrobiota bacterium]|tara:strand:- start:9323 stop:9820 length:498 start_codon:yes stop_codon:yes gene_type:complete